MQLCCAVTACCGRARWLAWRRRREQQCGRRRAHRLAVHLLAAGHACMQHCGVAAAAAGSGELPVSIHGVRPLCRRGGSGARCALHATSTSSSPAPGIHLWIYRCLCVGDETRHIAPLRQSARAPGTVALPPVGVSAPGGNGHRQLRAWAAPEAASADGSVSVNTVAVRARQITLTVYFICMWQLYVEVWQIFRNTITAWTSTGSRTASDIRRQMPPPFPRAKAGAHARRVLWAGIIPREGAPLCTCACGQIGCGARASLPEVARGCGSLAIIHCDHPPRGAAPQSPTRGGVHPLHPLPILFAPH